MASQAAFVEMSGDGSFDLDDVIQSRKCVVCLEEHALQSTRTASCQNTAHGVCDGCLAAALMMPKRRNPLTRADGCMGCVAGGCAGEYTLRELLEVLPTKEQKRHVLGIVADLRKQAAAPTATKTKTATDAARLQTKKNQLRAAVNFMQKPEIRQKAPEAIEEYLKRNGVDAAVIAMAREVSEGKRTLDSVTFEEEAEEEVVVEDTSSRSHAPVFSKLDETTAHLDAIWATELVSGEDIASLLTGKEHTKKKKQSAMKRAQRDKINATASASADSLEKQGWAVIDDFCSVDLVGRVMSEVGPMEDLYTASEIWVGAESSVGAQMSVPEVRGDKVLWMCGGHPEQKQDTVEPCEAAVKKGLSKKSGAARLSKSQVAKFPALRDLLKCMDAFVIGELVPQLKRDDVKSRSDAMFAIYPGDGSRFQAHVDNTTDDGRVLTVLCYLNENWTPESGGALRLHPPGAAPLDVAPKAGRLAMFYSAGTKHEVRPCFFKRAAVTLWYYSDKERLAAIGRSKEEEHDKPKVSFTDEERRAAQEFAKELCAPVKAASTQAELDGLAAKAALLPEKSQHILAGMAGLPETHFLTGLRRLSKEDLQGLRDRFKKMGV